MRAALELSSNDSKVDKLVLVVHGVGDPEPGETLGLFARSMAEDHHPLGERQTTVWLPEKSKDSNYVTTFPAHVRNLENEAERVELIEVFWGDLSRVWRGLPGTIIGMFQVLFGLRYVAYVAADQPGRAAFWLKRIGLNCSKILHGPVLAVTFFMGILATAVAGTHLMWAESYKSVLWTQIVMACCCAFAMLVSSVGWRMTNSRVFERFWFWVNVTAMFIAGLMVVKAIWMDGAFPDAAYNGEVRPGIIWYCRVLVVLLGLLWFAEILLMIGMAVCWVGALMHPRAHRPALHIAFLLPALSIGIWGQMLPMIWIAINSSANKLFKLPELNDLFEEAIPLLGTQFFMAVVMAIAAAVIGYRFIRWRTANGIGEYEDGARPPRLIVHGFVQLVLAICTIVGVCLVLGIGLMEFRGISHGEFWFGRLMAEANKYAMGILVPSSVMAAFLIPRLRPVFDIVLDVVNHFHFRATHISDALDDEDEFDIKETTFEQGTLFFSRRDAIHLRLKRILNFYRDTLKGQRPELIIVGHSQGTMVAIEVLNDPELSWLTNQFSAVKLVTMGSPLSNLYQHYFAHLYPQLESPFWSSLRKRTDRWINIFRIDDPVGTEIHFPESRLTPAESCEAFHDGLCVGDSKIRNQVYSNHPVGCRGHTYYFNDREVLEILKKELFHSCSDEHRYRAA